MTEGEFIAAIREICLRRGAERAVLFGSRARSENAPNSDFDVAVYGPADVASIARELDALPTLFSADVVGMDSCTNQALAREVERDGITL